MDSEGERTDLDNDRLTIDSVKWGLLKRAGAGRSGSFYLDDFQSFRTRSP